MSATPLISLYDLVLCSLTPQGNIAPDGVVTKETSDPETGTTLFVASSETEDRMLDVIRQNWKLAEFRQYGPILDNHIRTRVAGIGIKAWVPKKESSEVAKADIGRLHVRARWDLDCPDPSIRAVGHQHVNGIRKGGSVGFVCDNKTRRDKLPSDHQWFSTGKEVKTSWGPYKMHGTYFDGPTLREFSSAGIPANGNALQKSLVEAYAGLAIDDVEARAKMAGEAGVPGAVVSDLVEQVKAMSAEGRAELATLLYPDLVHALRADPKLGLIVRGALERGRTPIPTDGDVVVVDFMSALAANLNKE